MQPTQTPREDAIGGDTFKHPAFGQIVANRVNGQNKGSLYCSDFTGNSYIAVTISGSVLTRNLSSDWLFPTKEKIEVRMSEAQWATFVSAMNVGAGTPCTISHENHERTPPIEWGEDRSARFKLEMDETLVSAMEGIEALSAMIHKKPMSKKARVELLLGLDRIKDNVSGNVDFVSDQFGEHIEKTVEAAKAEVHGYMTATMATQPALAAPTQED
jgi:hypothetical protein